MKKRLLSLLLALIMVVSLIPISVVNATEIPVVTLGQPFNLTIGEDGQQLQFTPQKDGWYAISSNAKNNDDPYITLWDSAWEELSYEDDSYSDYNFCLKHYLSAGETYYMSIGAYLNSSETITFDLLIEETVVAVSGVVTKMPFDPTVIEGYESDTYDCSGLEITFTLSDGSTAKWSYDRHNTVNGAHVYYDYFIDDQTGNFYVSVTCEAATVDCPFESVENPIDHISYSGTPISYYENTYGYYEGSAYVYEYELPDDATITVHYKDGSSITGSMFDPLPEGPWPNWNDSQVITPWSIGSDNLITVYYLGHTTTIPVTILASPFKSVTINSSPSRTYIWGDDAYGYLEDGYYTFCPSDLTGLSFTVEFADGTTKTYTDADIDMDAQLIDDYLYDIEELTCSNTGTYSAVLNYKGYPIDFSVSVAATPVKTLELVKAPDKTECTGFYLPVLDGAQLRLTLNDDTTKTVTVTKDNVHYFIDDNFTLHYVIDCGEYPIYAYMDYTYDTNYLSFSCFGAAVTCPITYGDTDFVDAITAEISSPDADGTILHVTYRNGQTETLTMDVCATVSYGDNEFDGYARTENGITNFSISPDYDSDYGDGYWFYIFNESFYVPKTQKTFSDVQTGSWYDIPVQWAVNCGVTTGTGDGTTFSPDKPCTRAQVVTFIWRVAGEELPSISNPFTDVPDDQWYSDAVLWAVEEEITSGKGSLTTFMPNATCTRAEVVTFLWRACGKPAPANDDNPFTDVPDGQWYTDAILWAVEEGITTGTGDGTTFSPNNPCTRAHVVTFLWRCVNG